MNMDPIGGMNVVWLSNEERREIFLIIDIHGNLFIFQSNDCSFHSQNKTRILWQNGYDYSMTIGFKSKQTIYFWLKVLRVAMTDLILGLLLGLLSQHCVMSL